MNPTAGFAVDRIRRGRAWSFLVGSFLFVRASGCSIYDQALIDAATAGPGEREPAGSTTETPLGGGGVATNSGGEPPIAGGAPPLGGAPSNSTGGQPNPGTGGMGGSGGIDPQPTDTCADYPLTSRALWFASSWPHEENPQRAVDLNTETRWSSAAPMTGSEWIAIDFGADVLITEVVVHHDGTDYARGFEAIVGEEPATIETPPQVSGANSDVELRVVFPEPERGRYLTIRQSGASGSWWSVVELEFLCED